MTKKSSEPNAQHLSSSSVKMNQKQKKNIRNCYIKHGFSSFIYVSIEKNIKIDIDRDITKAKAECKKQWNQSECVFSIFVILFLSHIV